MLNKHPTHVCNSLVETQEYYRHLLRGPGEQKYYLEGLWLEKVLDHKQVTLNSIFFNDLSIVRANKHVMKHVEKSCGARVLEIVQQVSAGMYFEVIV